MQPHHRHDCSRCRLVGAVAGPNGPVDLYRCDSPADPHGITYVARFSSDGPDYTSNTDKVMEQHPGTSPFPRAAMLLAQLLSQDQTQ